MTVESAEKYIAKTGTVWVLIIYALFTAHVSGYLKSKPGELNEWLKWFSLLFPFFLLHMILIAKIRCALSPIMKDEDTLIRYVPLLNTVWLLRNSRRMAQYLGWKKMYWTSVAGTLVFLLAVIVLHLSGYSLLCLTIVLAVTVAFVVLEKRRKSIKLRSFPVMVSLMACIFVIVCIGYIFAPHAARLLRILFELNSQFMGGLALTALQFTLPPPPAASQEAPSP